MLYFYQNHLPSMIFAIVFFFVYETHLYSSTKCINISQHFLFDFFHRNCILNLLQILFKVYYICIPLLLRNPLSDFDEILRKFIVYYHCGIPFCFWFKLYLRLHYHRHEIIFIFFNFYFFMVQTLHW